MIQALVAVNVFDAKKKTRKLWVISNWINQLFHLHVLQVKRTGETILRKRWNALLSGCLLSQTGIKVFECLRAAVEGFKRQWNPEGVFVMLTDVKDSPQNELCTQWTRITCFNIRNQWVYCTCKHTHTHMLKTIIYSLSVITPHPSQT